MFAYDYISKSSKERFAVNDPGEEQCIVDLSTNTVLASALLIDNAGLFVSRCLYDYRAYLHQTLSESPVSLREHGWLRKRKFKEKEKEREREREKRKEKTSYARIYISNALFIGRLVAAHCARVPRPQRQFRQTTGKGGGVKRDHEAQITKAAVHICAKKFQSNPSKHI